MSNSTNAGKARVRPNSKGKRRAMMQRLLAASALSMLVPAAAHAQATIVVFDGSEDDQWTTPHNWSWLYFDGTLLPIVNVPDDTSVSTIAHIDNGLHAQLSGANATIINLVVGSKIYGFLSGKGELTISDGARLKSEGGVIGQITGSEGRVNVTSGAQWNMDFGLAVGHSGGKGELLISGGAVVSANENNDPAFAQSQVTILAQSAGSEGLIRVSGAGSQLSTKNMIVGSLDKGTLEILAGGTVSSTQATLAGSAGGNAEVLISGANSTWSLGGPLTIGANGPARITVGNGGRLATSNAILFRSGSLNIGGAAGAAAAAPGTVSATAIVLQSATAELVFNHTANDYLFNVPLISSGRIRHIAGVTRLTDAGRDFPGVTEISGGRLIVDGVLGGTVTMTGGALAGAGRLSGSLTVGAAELNPGNSPGKLTIDGNLALSQASILNFELGAPGGTPGVTSDLIEVGGQLTLDGTLNVIDAGGFGDGLYRLFNYGGGLTDNGLEISAAPAGFAQGDLAIQTAVAGQVNLAVGATVSPPGSYTYWDGGDGSANGVISGGSGTWSAAGFNWTNADGSENGRYDPAGLLIFAGAPGTVTVDRGTSAALDVGHGIQFFRDGYRITGDGLGLTAPDTIIRVGDGTAAGADYYATIASNLSGGGFVKTDLGNLVLTGNSSLAGTTRVTNGVLEVQGRLESDLDVQQGELRVTFGGVVAAEALDFGNTPSALGAGITVDGLGSLLDLTGLPSGRPFVIAENLGQSEATLMVRNGGIVRMPTTHAIISGSEEAPGLSTIIIGSAIGEELAAPGMIETPLLRTEAGGSRLIFNHTSNGHDFAPDISTRADLGGTTDIYHEAGVTNLLGDAGGLIGTVTVNGGTLNVQHRLGGTVMVNGGTLGGSGLLTGTVTVGDARLSPGNSPGTLSFGGDLVLTSASVLDFELGAPGGTPGVDSDLINVAGNLTLDGTLNAIDAGGFGDGLYRLFNYGGALTDNGLVIGATPLGYAAGDLTVQTATAGQVNLLVASTPTPPGSYRFWDGSGAGANGVVEGGGGTWSLAGTNWTTADGSANGAYDPTQLLIFSGTGGTVLVDASSGPLAIGSGMQFASDGYRVTGGALELNAPNTTVRVGDGSTTGANHSATIGAELTGAGRLVKDDLGTLILTGANSHGGGTTINAGTLAIGNGGTSGSIAGPVLNNGTLAFNRSDDVSFAGIVTGIGTLRQVGTGRIELTGNSGTFAGSTFVEAGTLAVNGSLGGALDVLAAGRLQGTGTVGNTIVRGTIAPGNSIGTLNVAGNITFAAGSIYEVEANAAGQADKIVASGNATLQGGTVQVLAGAGSYEQQTDYTILTAGGGVSGTFAGVTSNLAFLDPSLRYDASNVYLRLQRNDASFGGIGMTPNQIATGEATEALGGGNAVFDAVVNLSAGQARDAFDQLSGEIHPSARTAMLEDSRFVRNAVWDRLRAGAGEPGGGVWGQAIGSQGHTGSNGNAARLDRSTGGLLMGVDAASDTMRLGAVWGYSRTDIDVKARGSSGKIDSFHLGAYAGGQWGSLGLRAGIAYAWHDVHTTRGIAFPGFGDTLRAGYRGDTLQTFGELAYGLDLGSTKLEPYANLAHVRAHSGTFAETGGEAKLAGGKASSDVTFTNLGLRTTTTFDLSNADATFRAGLGWRHVFGDTVPVAAMRYQAGGPTFAIGGLPFVRDAATLDAGLDIAVSGKTSIGISYSGQIADRLADHGAKANISFKF